MIDTRALVRRLLLAMMLGVVVYAGFVLYRGVSTIGAELSRFSWWAFAAALGLTFANYVLRFVKWEFYLHKLGVKGVPKLDSFIIYLSGFVLTVTPGKVGEVFKSLVLNETHGVPMPKTAPIVIAERLTDLIGIIGLVLVGSVGFAGGAIWAGVGAGAVVVALALISSRTVPEAIIGFMERKSAFLAKLSPKVRQAWDSLQELTTPGALILPAVLSLVSWSLEGAALWVLLRGFSSDVPWTIALFAYSTSQLAGALIPVPGGLGVTEGSLEQQLVRLGGAPLSVATSAMILVRFATLWFAVLLGFVALGVLRQRFPKMLSGPPEEQGEGA